MTPGPAHPPPEPRLPPHQPPDPRPPPADPRPRRPSDGLLEWPERSMMPGPSHCPFGVNGKAARRERHRRGGGAGGGGA